MNVITHLLVGWTLAEEMGLKGRDRALVTWAGVVPDLDGLTVFPNLGTRMLGLPETDFYFRYHHVLAHGLPAALVTTAAAFAFGLRRWKVAGLALLSFHLHLLGDLVGSRGPTRGDLWPIGYLEPFSRKLTLIWTGQWALNDWRNIILTLALLGLVFVRAVKRGSSPIQLFSERANTIFVETLRRRFARTA